MKVNGSSIAEIPRIRRRGRIIVSGSIAIDGDGALRAGSSGDGGQEEPNLSFDQSLFGQLKAYGTAGILQNSWREIR